MSDILTKEPRVRHTVISLDGCEFKVARAGLGTRGQRLDDIIKDLKDENFEEKFLQILFVAMDSFYSESDIRGFVENDLILGSDLHVIVSAMRGTDLDSFKKKVPE